MAIKSIEEILQNFKSIIPDDTSDETIGFIEDVTDTIHDLENKAKGDGKDWKSEAERIDKEWREKYKARFFSGTKDTDEVEPEEVDESIKNYSFEDLFKKE